MRISDWSSDVCSSDLAMRPAQEAASGLRPGNIAEVEHHLDVIDAHVAERALEQARRPDRRHQRRVAAETAAVDADAILVRVALVDRPFRGVDDVVLDAFGPLLVRSEEHTSELQSLIRNWYAVSCWKNKI